MTVADMLDGAVEILKLSPRTVITLTAAVVLPAQLAIALISTTSVSNPTIAGVLGAPIFVGQIGSDRNNAVLVLYVLSSVVLPILTAAMAWLVASWYGGSSPSVAAVARAVGRRVPALLAAWLLVHVVEIVAGVVTFFVLGLGGFLVVPLLALTAPVIAVEGIGPIAAMRRSVRLARRGYMRLTAVVVFSAFVENVVFISITALSELVLGLPWGWIITSSVIALATIVCKPIVAGATALAYIDLRVRVEGLDIDLAVTEMARATPAAPARVS
jgi:hypothetical protein